MLVTLRRAFPAATIDWVVQDEFAAAVASHPDLDEAVCFPRKHFARWWRSPPTAVGVWRWLDALHRRRYGLVIDFQGLSRSGLITFATRARRRVGVRSAREFGWLAYNVRHAPSSAHHTVERMMSLLVAEGLEPVYDMRVYLADEDRRWWAARRRELGITDAGYVVLAAASRWASKRWPQKSWNALVEPLCERGFKKIVLVGSPSEHDQVAPIVGAAGPAAPIADLVGQTSVGGMMAVIADASLVIANDSAPLHLAVGFDRRCIGLYGPTDPKVVGPYGHESTVRVCRAATAGVVSFKDSRLGDSLMRLIKPADVLRRVDELVDASAATVQWCS